MEFESHIPYVNGFLITCKSAQCSAQALPVAVYTSADESRAYSFVASSQVGRKGDRTRSIFKRSSE